MKSIMAEKMKKVWNYSKYYLLALTMGLYLGSATAGIEDSFARSFDGMVNSTPAGRYNSQKRGVITGGSFYYRQKIFRANLVNFTPPSFKAGCGGIDFFGGSFSFINAEQFEQLLRNIASNATGYLFEMALTSVCPTCNDILKKLQDTMTELNSLNANSCQLAQDLVNGDPSRVKKMMAGAQGAIKGVVRTLTGDPMKSSEAVSVSGNGDAQSAGQSVAQLPGGTAEMEKQTIGSVTYIALQKKAASSWLNNLGGGTGNSRNTYEFLQSIAGTIVIKRPQGDKLPEAKIYSGRITLEQVMKGGDVDYLACGDVTLCENITETTRYVEGVSKVVNRVLFGNADPDTNGVTGGIVEKMYDINGYGTGSLTYEEQGLIAASSPGLLATLRSVMADRDTMEVVARHYAAIVTSQISTKIVEEMIKIAQYAVENEADRADAGEMTKMIVERRKEIDAEKKNMEKLVEQFNTQLQVVDTLRGNLKRINPVTLAIPGV